MQRTVADHIILFFATGFYSGYSPVAPGTAGSLVGVIVYWLLLPLGWPVYAAATAAITVLGIWVSGRAETLFGKKDCQNIVIDEVAGQLIALFLVPPTLLGIAAGFGLFRLFDIAKFWPIAPLQNLNGGMGVMMDDVAAGVIACALLHAVLLVL